MLRAALRFFLVVFLFACAFFFVVFATSGCSTKGTAVRDLAAQELACPTQSVRVAHVQGHFYRATGCGASVEVACYDPYESTGAAKGWADGLRAGNRVHCETLLDRSVALTSAVPRGAGTTAVVAPKPFDREAARRLIAAGAERVRSCARPGGPSGYGEARLTFSSDGTSHGVVIEPPFAGTEVGRCVADELARVTVPPFQGEAVTLLKRFEITSATPAGQINL